MPDEKVSQTPHATFDTSTRYRLWVKIGILMAGLTFGAILSSGWFHYHKNVELILRNLQNQLQLAANTIAISIDGDQYRRLQGVASKGTPEYQAVKRVLEDFMRNHYLGFERECIYTFRQVSPDSVEFTVMLQDEFVGHRYPIRPEMRLTLQEGKPSYTGIYQDENGTWVSAYAPITDSRGAVVGMVEVDFKNNVYLKAVRNEIYTIMIFSVIGIGAALVVAWLLARYISRPVVDISRAALEVSRGNLEVSVSARTRDEIGMLARAFNYMVSEIKQKEFFRRRNRELQEAYDRLDKLNRELQEANRLKSEFLSIAAHDLKNPLQVIMGYAELISHTKGVPRRVQESAEKIKLGTERMVNIISHILDTSLIESGKLELKKEVVDVGALVAKVVENNRPLAEKKQQQLQFFPCEAPCAAEVDPERMDEVVDNLISNAIKFSPPGRGIFVRVKRTPGGNARREVVRIEVEDEGPGLTEEDQQHLFGQFQRLSAQPTGGETSTGLGLSVVRQLVELHGGRVWAESNGPGTGATFIVELQAVASQSNSLPTADGTSSPSKAVP